MKLTTQARVAVRCSVRFPAELPRPATPEAVHLAFEARSIGAAEIHSHASEFQLPAATLLGTWRRNQVSAQFAVVHRTRLVLSGVADRDHPGR